MNKTLLSTIISRMNRYTLPAQIDEAFKVRDLDEALRSIRRETQTPWTMQKATLKVFPDVLEYPLASDHDEIAYLDVSNNTFFPFSAQFRYTSLKQFFQDPTNRNEIAEIWDGSVRFLGVNYKDTPEKSTLIDNAEDVSLWTASGDASSPTLDIVTFAEGSSSIAFTVTNSSGTATMRGELPSTVQDARYKKKYKFIKVYLAAVPTSITLKLEVDGSNHLSGVVTTQFSGQAFKANDWNVLAINLDTATAAGTITTASIFAYHTITLTGAASGTYFIDASYLREWTLLDYWYYSKNNIVISGSTNADREYFIDDSLSPNYSTDLSLVGDTEWADVIMYDAMLTEYVDTKDPTRAEIEKKRDRAWNDLITNYPSEKPLVTTNRYNFKTDFAYADIRNGQVL